MGCIVEEEGRRAWYRQRHFLQPPFSLSFGTLFPARVICHFYQRAGYHQPEHCLDAYRKEAEFLRIYLLNAVGQSSTSTEEIPLGEK